MSMPVSLKMIAKKAGVSRTTVSLALRNHPRIRECTRIRIQKIAQDLGYQPNADVSKVMGFIRESKPHHDQPVLGLITDMPTPISSPHSTSLTWKGFQERASSLGYRPEEFWLGDQKISPKRLQEILHARGIRGFVVSSLRDRKFLAQMDLTGFAAAIIGHAIHEPVLHRASSDKYTNTLMSCEKLWEQGCRRIGLAVPKLQEDRVENLFLSGYLVFHQQHRHAEWPTPLVEDSEWDTQYLADWAKAEKLDGMIVAQPGLESHLPDIPIAQVNLMQGNHTGMNQCHDRIAAGAVDLVDAQLRRNEFGIPTQPKTMLIVGKWID